MLLHSAGGWDGAVDHSLGFAHMTSLRRLLGSPHSGLGVFKREETEAAGPLKAWTQKSPNVGFAAFFAQDMSQGQSAVKEGEIDPISSWEGLHTHQGREGFLATIFSGDPP